jgi:uncharacterized phage protein (TIGR02218 family)
MSKQIAPIELYKITCGEEKWFYTSADKTYSYGGNDYIAVPMGRSAIESKGQVKKENLEVTFAVDNPMAKNFLMYTPDQMVYLTVYIINEGGAELYVGWKGRLSAVKPNKSQLMLVFESIYTSIQSSLLTQSYQRNCRHMLYSERGCRVNKNDRRLDIAVESINGYILQLVGATGHPSGYFVGGIVEYKGGARGVMGQTWSTFTLNDVWPSLARDLEEAQTTGEPVIVSIYPGCDRTMSTCFGKFENLENFGGFPVIPFKNPFDGSIT